MLLSTKLRVAGVSVLAALTWVGHACAQTGDAQAITRAIDSLRGIDVPKESARIAELNQRMDAAWKVLLGRRDAALPRVAAALREEQAAARPDQFFLLDLAHFLVVAKHPDAVAFALDSLEKIDPRAPVIRANWQETFDLTLAVGIAASPAVQPRYLRAVDRVFLGSDERLFLVTHVIYFGWRELAASLYGVTGEAGAKHLAAVLPTTPHRARVLALLRWLGSEEQMPAVRACLAAPADFETFAPAVDFAMTLGGPGGRAALLAIDEAGLEPRAREYLRAVRPKVEAGDFVQQREALRALSPGEVSDARLRRLLDAMESNNGVDAETPPGAIVDSGLPVEELLATMKRIRARSFRRVSPHALDDLPVFNAVINALQFKRALP